MDVLAHSLWTNVVFYKKYRHEIKQRLLAVFFGVAPDLVSFTPAFLYVFLSGKRFSIESFNSSLWVFRYAAQSYNFTHSIVVFAVAFLAVMAFRRGRQYWPMWGWALHIGIDIFSHRGFYETPFLFPLSGYRFSHGISWAHPVFMLVNYSLLILVYIILFLVSRKKHVPEQS